MTCKGILVIVYRVSLRFSPPNRCSLGYNRDNCPALVYLIETIVIVIRGVDDW